ncbi:16S rRNA (uracil1498-N3)-methyltransferase [Thermolongibacillus altinsuensis]|uniref:Ribosomal RNA small subunit methyltransferase E n=1 Tax=Thermolongibacillus altinsuensis TaxID=575256 RepID=A0A4R1QEF0_9BACL|nr:16S rRNA (uracil(1498)-N(3))-methyltransferase [Thermolongibacillus altinsuensis]TCL48867.1 16S rRNA (uracil1498-N3)-methyltransferase [Thermolongibacillus altinsuensis]GMB07576.1 ribosomal RNA small subunit methyltransferase E [Thermolongibacillus altinsuensis]
MQQYFISNEQIYGDRLDIRGDDVHHIARVMRMNTGDRLLCCNEDGQTALCKIEEISNDFVRCRIIEWIQVDVELPAHVYIANGLLKGDKFELVIQKGTELGAFSFIPLKAARSVVKWDEKKGDKKIERWQKIAKEAAEQSHRTRIPSIFSPLSIEQLIEWSRDVDYKIIAYEEEAKRGERKQLKNILRQLQRGQSIVAVFGPEGGFSEQEVAMLKENGFISCSLGPRILRAETAPLYFLSAVSYELEFK